MTSIKEDGKRRLSFRPGVGTAVNLPCGQCQGCRLERAKQWAVRIMHEAQMHESNCFITLTYSPEKEPYGRTLVKRHVQLFFKKLRKHLGPETPVRYFMCGEYGSLNQRPHYHAIVFGYDFPDKLPFKVERGNVLSISPLLDKLWGFGLSSVGALSAKSAAYCARYSLKKVQGEEAERHYEHCVEGTGELVQRQPEYVAMSLKPGIGKAWFERFGSDVFPSDQVVIGGAAGKPPRYYDQLYGAINPGGLRQIKNRRALDMHLPEQQLENDSIRLRVKERVCISQLTQLKREL